MPETVDEYKDIVEITALLTKVKPEDIRYVKGYLQCAVDREKLDERGLNEARKGA